MAPHMSWPDEIQLVQSDREDYRSTSREILSWIFNGSVLFKLYLPYTGGNLEISEDNEEYLETLKQWIKTNCTSRCEYSTLMSGHLIWISFFSEEDGMMFKLRFAP